MNPRDAAQHLTEGSAALARRLTDRACGWCRRGYRHDLTGWRAALGPAIRAGTLILAGWTGWHTVRAVPALLWAAVPAWAITAWRTAPRPSAGDEETASAEASVTPPADAGPALSMDAFSALVRTVADGGAGAHLSALAEHLTGSPENTPAVRALCRDLGVPVSGSVRQRGRGVSTGVKVTDLPPPPPAPLPGASVAVVVAGQPAATGTTTTTATPSVDRHDWGVTLAARDGAYRKTASGWLPRPVSGGDGHHGRAVVGDGAR